MNTYTHANMQKLLFLISQLTRWGFIIKFLKVVSNYRYILFFFMSFSIMNYKVIITKLIFHY